VLILGFEGHSTTSECVELLRETRLLTQCMLSMRSTYEVKCTNFKTGQVERGYRRVRAPVNTSRGNVPYVILAQNI
jgi:hypothetical protein